VPALAELAAFEPPPYTPVRLRGSADVAGERFLRAMEPYAKGDYRAALVGLAAAAELDPRAPHAVFFLGACYLLTDQPDAAIRAFQRAIALGDSPYLEGAHFYLAKALLRKGELAAAAAELHKTVHRKGELESRAQELLAQVERLSNAPR
jgi:tetratricopeptide (TPR) repeat protein